MSSLTGRPSAIGAWRGAGALAAPNSDGSRIGSKIYRKTRDTSAPLPGAGRRAAMSASPRVSSALRPGADIPRYGHNVSGCLKPAVDPQETFGLDGLTPRPNLNSLAYTCVREEMAHG